MIYIRTDGNPQIGSGHIMRCLSLADAFRNINIKAKFIIAEPYLEQIIRSRGYSCTVLGTTYNRLEEETQFLFKIFDNEQPEFIILDSYFVTPNYMAAVKSKAPLLYIDDLNMFDYPADVIVNYNIYGSKTDYPSNKIYLLGTQYVPLRKEFMNLKPRTLCESIKNVMISTGGTDQYHIALKCAEYLSKFAAEKDINFHLVIGAMNQDLREIEKIVKNFPFIKLHCQVNDMCSLMLKCDAAISAAGSTLYELCACGLPTVTYVLADNQIQGASAFEEAGLMLNAGDIRKNPRFIRDLFEKLKVLEQNISLYIKSARGMKELVDGKGASRLAKTIANLIG